MSERKDIEYNSDDSHDTVDHSKILSAESDTTWHDNGAALILKGLMQEILKTFNLLIEEARNVKKELLAHITNPDYFDSLVEFAETDEGEIDPRGKLWGLESKLKDCAQMAVVMAAIDLEANVNMFCFYNLGEVTTNAIESLSLTGKLEVIHKVLGLTNFKGTHQFAAADALRKWRNAFVHGKCTDMTVRTIKDNHITKRVWRDPMNIVREALDHLHEYFVVYSHLEKISKHPYTTERYAFDLIFLYPYEEQLRTIRGQLNYAKDLLSKLTTLEILSEGPF